ncbi:MAG TPA: response regulator transcription factor [Tenuifilaceae bacterium]|nr:response regulator transcription factor [Tenuifilaceae bacterium]HPI45277.1 response regulator transcription factor [Tenuifilaceae bacterium]HPN20653.1 response regulator transcription factor [Tenuifilaceae bacterium]
MNKILIVDDHPLVAQSLQSIVTDSKVGEVVAIAHTAKQCLDFVASKHIDLVLLDINLPDGNGLDICKSITEKYPQIKVLAITTFSEYTIIRKMLDNGASGYILKNSLPEEVVEGIETVLKGETFLCHEVDLLMKKKSDEQIFLTPRETDLLKLICDGYTNPEIAEKLYLGVETINSYRKNLLFKLNARNTAVLVKIAMEQKLI